jgi:hypothetical protein
VQRIELGHVRHQRVQRGHQPAAGRHPCRGRGQAGRPSFRVVVVRSLPF